MENQHFQLRIRYPLGFASAPRPSHRARDMARFAESTSSMEETIEAGGQEEDGNQDLQDSMYIYIYIYEVIYMNAIPQTTIK